MGLFKMFGNCPCSVVNASVGTIDSSVVATVATVNNAYLNNKYPKMSIGGKVVFTNITAAATTVLTAIKLTQNTWYTITGTKLT